MSGLTSSQRNVLEFIASHISERGMPPTRPEISAHFGWHSANAAEDAIKILARKGFVETIRGVARGLRLTGKIDGQASPPEAAQHQRRPDMAPAKATMARVDRDRPAVARVEVQKTPNRVQQSIRDSARGEECTVRIQGVCNHDPATTVWSHFPLNDAGKGMAMKGLDLVGCYSCSACHDVVDGRAKAPAGMTRELVLLDWMYGHLRSLVKLRQKGLV